MKKIIHTVLFFLIIQLTFGQTPVPMSVQPGLVYTENFADIANWTNGFASGMGANRFGAVPVSSNGTIPAAGKTTASSATFSSGTSTGVQKGSGNIILLSTSATDNTTAVAFDLLLNFSGANAGTLSFNWASVNNSSGDRKGSLRVYASPDGTTFIELTAAAVLNFTNNILASGSVSSIGLPASFNYSATSVLRFYYHNGTGGTTGSRPKISIDNISVTAVAANPCDPPAAQPASLVFSNITANGLQGDFTQASPAANQYLTVASTNNSLTSNPVDGQTYLPGDGLGDGFVVENSSALVFNATGLTSSTTYYFFIFSVNTACGSGPKYLATNPLTGNATTITGLPNCTAPLLQPINLSFFNVTVNSIPGKFADAVPGCNCTAVIPANDSEYIILRTTNTSLTTNPVNGQTYNPGDIVGNATVVQRSNATTFIATGLTPNTTYRFFIFSLNSKNCSNGPVYNVISPLTGIQTTLPLPSCALPILQPTLMVLNATNNAISGYFTPTNYSNDYLIIRSNSPTLSASPVNNTDYSVGNSLGGGIVIGSGSSTNFISTGLTPGTTYYFFVFSNNKNCTGGTMYLTSNPLTGNATTSNIVSNNYYFGNFHSHSDYSDGNKDNPGYTPADNYNYALTSQCMNFLGISEHNHFSSPDNPGNHLATYHTGTAQANAFNTAHPNFIAMYGMEWGVISGGGHVLVYGNGMDNLFGWESGSGAWGSSNNYDVYVPKSTYTGTTGLFKVINDNIATNTFASLAHPNLTDFNNIAGIAYNAAADDAITATAVESGPATSTNTSYSNPGSSMSYLWYYQTLLSKGYHLGPSIDHDNHNTTFGRTTYSRTAIVAPSLSKTEIIKAMRDMHFYATQDCDSKVDFTINTKMMGSIITDRSSPVISVTLTDATTSISSAVIKIMFGVPGSGSLPVILASGTGGTLNYIDANLLNSSTGYYYIDITNGSSRIITSPIWYTRNDLARPSATPVSSFGINKTNDAAQINWGVEHALSNTNFTVERSTNGISWNTINAGINNKADTSYEIFDDAPKNGINYYRLKEVGKDGFEKFSEVRNIVYNISHEVNIIKDGAESFINVSLVKTNTGISSIEIIDMNGKKVYTEKGNGSFIKIHTSRFGKGIYFVKVIGADAVTVKKVLLR